MVSVKNQVFYHVDFDDGSYSDNLFPEDVQVNSATFMDPLGVKLRCNEWDEFQEEITSEKWEILHCAKNVHLNLDA